MSLKGTLAAALLAALSTLAVAAQAPAPAPELSVAQIIERNALARGGVPAWHQLQTMAWTGHVESGTAPGRKLPFLLQQKRPNMARFELIAEGQKSVRVFDGSTGWKMRAASGGRPELQPYSMDELTYARGAQVIEGPLMDFVDKGAAISLAGMATLNSRQAYVLDVKLPSGGAHRVWVDAQTFLETRADREYRDASGQSLVATVWYRDYRAFDGLQLPVTIETRDASGRASNTLVIERVALNPALDEHAFEKPVAPVARRMGAVVVDTRSAAQPNTVRPAPSR